MSNALLKNTVYLKSCATLQTYKPTLSDYQDQISRAWHNSLMLLIKISWMKKSFELFFAFAPNFSKIQNKFIFNCLVCFLKITYCISVVMDYFYYNHGSYC